MIPARTKNDADIEAARAAASALIDYYAIAEPGQISLHDIAYDRGVIVREGQLRGAEGRLVRRGSKGIIRVRSDDAYPGRVRFAIGHELGHWERHQHLSQYWMCTSDEIHAYAGSAIEQQANAFSSELLMPTRLLVPRLGPGLSVSAFRTTAEEFAASLTPVASRCVELSDEDAYVLFSTGDDRTVSWWTRSKRADRKFPKQFAIRSESFASCATVPPDRSPGPQKVETSAWFDIRHGEYEPEVWEESVYFRNLDIVMTLLILME